MRNIASRDEYVPQHGSRYKTKDTSSRGLADTRIRVRKIAAIGMLTSAVIILGITAKTYASERMAHSDASTVQTQNKKVSESKVTASQTLSTANLKTGLSKADFNDIPSGDTVQTFSLVDDQILALEDENLAALQNALDRRRSWAMGVVFYDLSSGKGVTYNADVEVYGASSYKALYALYICESLVETGQVSLDDFLGTYGGYNMGWQTVRDLIENAVANSDNDSFIALRAAFDHDGYEDWIANLGVDDETALNPMSDFPTYCPRTSARLWREMSEYLSMDTETFTVVVRPFGINIALVYSRWHCGRSGLGAQQSGLDQRGRLLFDMRCRPHRHRWPYLCHERHDIDAIERPFERGYGCDCKGSV